MVSSCFGPGQKCFSQNCLLSSTVPFCKSVAREEALEINLQRMTRKAHSVNFLPSFYSLNTQSLSDPTKTH